MPTVDPSASVHAEARLSGGVVIGPFCVVGPEVELGPGVELVAHVVVTGRTQLGPGTRVWPFAVLGSVPQSVRDGEEPGSLRIGARARIREAVTMNVGSSEDGVTVVGDDGFFMANAHVGHDCVVGDRVVLANSAPLGGHAQIGDDVFVGGNAAVHQFVRVGAHAIVGGLCPATRDVPPAALARGNPMVIRGVNVVGLQRRGFTEAQIGRAHAWMEALAAGERLDAEPGDPVDMLFAGFAPGLRGLGRFQLATR